MINLLDLFRPRTTENRYTAMEILAIVRGQGHGGRAQAALEVIAEPASWLPPDPRRAFGSLAWYAERLPMILHLYRRGWAPEQIGRKLTPLGGAWAVEQTLETAAGLIAERLNGRVLAA